MSATITPATVQSVAWEADRSLKSLAADIEAAVSIAHLLAQSKPLDERTHLAFGGLGDFLASIRSRMGDREQLFDATAAAARAQTGEAT